MRHLLSYCNEAAVTTRQQHACFNCNENHKFIKTSFELYYCSEDYYLDIIITELLAECLLRTVRFNRAD